jgi:hypothetical protein
VLLRQAGPLGTGAITYSPLPKDQNDSRATPGGHGSLAKPGEIGLGIGIVIAVFLFSVGSFLLFRRRKKEKAPSQEMDKSDDFRKAELPGSPVASHRNFPIEIDGYERKEMDSSPRVQDDKGDLFELPTTYNDGVELETSKSGSFETFEKKL